MARWLPENIDSTVRDGVNWAADPLGLGEATTGTTPSEFLEGTAGFGEGIYWDLQGDEQRSRDSWVATGSLRTAIDTVVDYDGEWGGMEDTRDLIGPGLWGTEGSVWDVIERTPGEDTSGDRPLWLWAALAAAALYLLAPLLTITAELLDDG